MVWSPRWPRRQRGDYTTVRKELQAAVRRVGQLDRRAGVLAGQLDPSGDRVLAPDLGQDKIHVLDIGDHHRLPFLARCVFTPLALRCRRALRQPEPGLLLHRAARLRPAASRVPPIRQVLLRRARDQLRGRGPLLRPNHRRAAVGRTAICLPTSCCSPGCQDCRTIIYFL